MYLGRQRLDGLELSVTGINSVRASECDCGVYVRLNTIFERASIV